MRGGRRLATMKDEGGCFWIGRSFVSVGLNSNMLSGILMMNVINDQ